MKIASMKNSKLLLKYGIEIDTDIVTIILKPSNEEIYSTVIRFNGQYLEIHSGCVVKTSERYMGLAPKKAIAIPRPTLDEVLPFITVYRELDVDRVIQDWVNNIRKRKKRENLNKFLKSKGSESK